MILKPNGLPVLSKQRLEEFADIHTHWFTEANGTKDPKFSAWEFATEYLRKKVSYEWLSNDGSILGASSFVDNTPIPVYNPETDKVRRQAMGKGTILLDWRLDSTEEMQAKRARFTLMHECAHHLLHQAYYSRLALSEDGAKVAYSVQRNEATRISFSGNETPWSDEQWLEWQANYLAGALLMPTDRLNSMLRDTCLLEEYRLQSRSARTEIGAFDFLAMRLAGEFGVNRPTARIRLEQSGFQRQKFAPDYSASIRHMAPPPVERKSQLQLDNERTIAELEEKYLDPDYIFTTEVDKNVKKSARRRERCKKAT